MSIDALKVKGIADKIPGNGINSVTVPGTVAGWHALHQRFGKLSMAEDWPRQRHWPKRALRLRKPMPTIGENMDWLSRIALASQASSCQVGKTPLAGQLFRNPGLAATLRRIGEHGRDGFYKGQTAAAILQLSDDLHGFLEADDLVDFQPEWVDPASTTYHGWTIWEMPPNGQGIAALSMLNIMEQFPIANWGHNSQKALHVEIEAKKLAYADLQQYIGDPHASHIPVQQLISKQLAAHRAAQITHRAQCSVLPSDLKNQLSRLPSDTTYLSTVDRDGNEVSLIQSNSGAFGSGLVPDGTGFVLQNRAGGFTLKPDRPNTLRPAPVHCIPLFLLSCKRAMNGLLSASWAASTRRRPMHSLFRTSQIFK